MGRIRPANRALSSVSTQASSLDRPVLVRQDLELMIRWVDRLWSYLVERDNFGPGENRRQAREMLDQAREHYRPSWPRRGNPRGCSPPVQSP